MLKFSDLSLITPLLENLTKLEYELPTDIQARAIPIVLEGRDILAIAQTGTGKTAAFCLPILQKLKLDAHSKGVRALVLAPTRELATQIHESFENYGKGLGITSLAIFGGVDQNPQVQSLRSGAMIVVATPGRLLDLMEQGVLRLGKVEVLVLDEADRMLDMGFYDDIMKIIDALPVERQSLFFSATMPSPVIKLSRSILSDPIKVEVTQQSSTTPLITQKVIYCKREDKFQLLRKILGGDKKELVVVFTKTKNTADKVKEYLRAHKIASAIFHGDISQVERERSLSNFKAGSPKILIATDMASRGLDVDNVAHVINFELPLEAASYIHRIGRTARAGKSGLATSFCEESEKPLLDRIQRLLSMILPHESFKATPEASGTWLETGSIRKVKAPTPGVSQEKLNYLDHSKRKKVVVAKNHPGFRSKYKKK